MLQWIAFVNKTIPVIGSQLANKQSKEFPYHSEKFFQPELRSQWSINMVKVLSFRFQQCFGPFPILHVASHVSHVPLNRDFLDIYQTTSFRVISSKIHDLWGSSFLENISKLNRNSENARKNSENIFRSWDNCIWKCCYKLCLLRREYLSSAVYRLTNSPKILHIDQREFFQLNCLHRDQ